MITVRAADPVGPSGTVTVYAWNGTSDLEGSKVSVVAEVSDHVPGAAGVMVGIGLPAASGWVRFTWIGPAGETPVSPADGDVDETASVTI